MYPTTQHFTSHCPVTVVELNRKLKQFTIALSLAVKEATWAWGKHEHFDGLVLNHIYLVVTDFFLMNEDA